MTFPLDAFVVSYPTQTKNLRQYLMNAIVKLKISGFQDFLLLSENRQTLHNHGTRILTLNYSVDSTLDMRPLG